MIQQRHGPINIVSQSEGESRGEEDQLRTPVQLEPTLLMIASARHENKYYKFISTRVEGVLPAKKGKIKAH